MDTKTKKGYSGRTFIPKQKNKKMDDDSNKNNIKSTCNRFLITINVVGSAGPIRFVASGDDNGAVVIETALKVYAREGRLPVLGSDINTFFLYPANDGFEAVKPSDEIGSYGVRNFVLCKKQGELQKTQASSQLIGSRWRLWLQKFLSLKILMN